MILLLLECNLLIGCLAVGVTLTSLWKIVKRPRLSLCGICEVVVEFAIYGVEGKLTIIRGSYLHEGLREEGDPTWHLRSLVVTHTSTTVISYFVQVNTRIHLRISVHWLSLYLSLFCCYSHCA
jgi:hypothetical protein